MYLSVINHITPHLPWVFRPNSASSIYSYQLYPLQIKQPVEYACKIFNFEANFILFTLFGWDLFIWGVESIVVNNSRTVENDTS